MLNVVFESSNSASFAYEDGMVASEVLLKSRERASTVLSLAVKPVISLNAIIRNAFPFMKPCFWAPSFPSCVWKVSGVIHSITFPGTGVRLTGPQLPRSSFLPFLKVAVTFSIHSLLFFCLFPFYSLTYFHLLSSNT